MKKEEWKLSLVSDNGTKYYVSNLGNVKTIQETVLSPYTGSNGYKAIVVNLNGKQHRINIHKLIAEAFLGAPKDKSLVVNHKDGNKANNDIENLEYVTQSENILHAYRMRLCKSGEEHGRATLSSKEVVLIRLLYQLGYSVNDLCEKFNVSYPNLRGIVNGERRKSEESLLQVRVSKTLGDKELKSLFSMPKEDGKVSIVINHQHGTSKDYVALSLEDFFKLVPRDNVILLKRGR